MFVAIMRLSVKFKNCYHLAVRSSSVVLFFTSLLVLSKQLESALHTLLDNLASGFEVSKSNDLPMFELRR